MAHDFSVLIVEDDEDARRNMEDILSLDGYQLYSANSCLAAMAVIETRHFDSVIVDWRLPDENADQLIPNILGRWPDTPVVVVTGLRDFDTAVTALRSGAYDFLLKPINPDALRSVLSRLVERKQHLAAIESAQAKLLVNERLAAIGQMVSGLAHESRNAFQRSHACLAELALDLQGMPDSLALVEKVQKALDDLHFLLEEVRQYSAPIILQRRDVSLKSLAQEMWQQIVDAQQMAEIPEFTINSDADFPHTCSVDPNRISQVIRNLLENALSACPARGQVRIRLRIEFARQSILIMEVMDSGPGIPPEDHEKIFAPFLPTKTKGTGLGLAVSRRHVEAHDGRVFVDSSYRSGAKFVVELPSSGASSR